MRLLAYDEHRLGLKPVYRRVWARRGERPLAVGAHRYRWFYVCTFVEPETGESLVSFTPLTLPTTPLVYTSVVSAPTQHNHTTRI
ncbi:hypothetical protein CSW40_10130 [Thermus scotoductus]|uniref:Uncharacterized protein n=1 Tax=Thermus scotoductus TaxID=37636 RepID=A0A430RTU8_THESC|nr:hypothetical protein CSW40_10130 [Thermus scotoductus]